MEQSKNIKLIQSYLKKNSISVIDLIGIIALMIITRDIFKKNSEVYDFVNDILDVRFPQYVIKSRTLMVARINRLLVGMDESQIKKIQLNLTSYLEEVNISEMEERFITHKKKKKNENEKLEKWLKGL